MRTKMLSNSTLEQLGRGNASANLTETAEIADDQECLWRDGRQPNWSNFQSHGLLYHPFRYHLQKVAKIRQLCIPLTITLIRIVKIVSGSDSWKVNNPRLLGNILSKNESLSFRCFSNCLNRSKAWLYLVVTGKRVRECSSQKGPYASFCRDKEEVMLIRVLWLTCYSYRISLVDTKNSSLKDCKLNWSD